MSGSKGPDAYEREFMSDGARVLLRDKTVWRAGVLMTGIPALATSIASAVLVTQLASAPAIHGPDLIGLGAATFAALVTGSCAALFAVLRVTVTSEHLQVQFGVLGPTIPIDAIESIEVAPYVWTRWGGWGVRGFGTDVAYSTTGPGRGVAIVYRKNGAEHRVFVTSYEPEAIVRAVNEAKALRGKPARTRVDVSVDAPDEGEDADGESTSATKRARR